MDNKKQGKRILKNSINLIILFLGTEVIRNLLTGIPEFKNLDIRIIFILIVSSYMGMKFGIISAILASISYIIQNYSQIVDIDIIFLNTNNWISFAIYIILSIIIGLRADKENLKDLNFQNEISNLRTKEVENNEKIAKYEKELKEFNQILISHNSSYIQVSKFINKINKNREDITRINNLLKIALDNKTCQLVRLDEINSELNNYIDTDKINIMKKNKIWINKNLDKEVPFYIAPVFFENGEKLVIIIWECPFEQMNTEYRNQVIGIAEILKYVFLH